MVGWEGGMEVGCSKKLAHLRARVVDNAVDEVSRHLRGGDAKRRAMLSSHLLQPPQVELCVME